MQPLSQNQAQNVITQNIKLIIKITLFPLKAKVSRVSKVSRENIITQLIHFKHIFFDKGGKGSVKVVLKNLKKLLQIKRIYQRFVSKMRTTYKNQKYLCSNNKMKVYDFKVKYLLCCFKYQCQSKLWISDSDRFLKYDDNSI